MGKEGSRIRFIKHLTVCQVFYVHHFITRWILFPMLGTGNVQMRRFGQMVLLRKATSGIGAQVSMVLAPLLFSAPGSGLGRGTWLFSRLYRRRHSG